MAAASKDMMESNIVQEEVASKDNNVEVESGMVEAASGMVAEAASGVTGEASGMAGEASEMVGEHLRWWIRHGRKCPWCIGHRRLLHR